MKPTDVFQVMNMRSLHGGVLASRLLFGFNAVAGALAGLLAAGTVAHACKCAPSERTLQEEKERYPVVVVGRAVRDESGHAYQDGERMHGERIEFELHRIWRGPEVRFIDINPDTRGSCAYEFLANHVYLVFADLSPDGEAWTMACFPTREAVAACRGYEAALGRPVQTYGCPR